MAYYYYDRYNIVSTTTYSAGTFTITTGYTVYPTSQVYTTYTLNTSTGIYSHPVSSQYGYLNNYGTGYLIADGGSTILKCTYSSGNVIVNKQTATATTNTSRGTLNQGNMILNDAYPSDGIRAGYWFVRKTLIQAPSLPVISTTIAKPLKVGDSLLITWSPSVDPQKFTISYTLQWSDASGATWKAIASGAMTSQAFVIPAGVMGSIQFRVEASNTYVTSGWNVKSFTVISNKFLFKDNENIKKFEAESGWVSIGIAPATKAMFDEHGMTSLSAIIDESIQSLTSTMPELLCWTDEEATKSYSADIVPTMTASATGAFYISGYEGVSMNDITAYRAFDDNSDTGWYAVGTRQSFGHGFNITLDTHRVISKITLKSRDATYSVRNWSFQGFDNNVPVVIATGLQLNNTNKQEYKFENNTAYKAYRFVCLDGYDLNANGLAEMELMEAVPAEVSRTANLTAIPHPQLLLPVRDIEVGKLESVRANTTGDIKLLISGDGGANWKGLNNTLVAPANLTDVKTKGFTPVQFNALTKEELASLFPNGKARFAFYLEKEKSTDLVAVQSLTINERQYTMTPSVERLAVFYKLLEPERPKLYASRDDGATWEEVKPDVLSSIDNLPEGNKLRVKAILKNGQELHGLSYSWI